MDEDKKQTLIRMIDDMKDSLRPNVLLMNDIVLMLDEIQSYLRHN